MKIQTSLYNLKTNFSYLKYGLELSMVVQVCAVGIGEAEAGRSDQEEPRLYRVLQDSLTQHEILF